MPDDPIYRAGNLIYGTDAHSQALTTTYLFEGTRFQTVDDDMWVWDGSGWEVMSGNTLTETLSAKTLTAPDVNGGTADSLTSLSVRDENVAYDLVIQSNDASMSSNRNLNIDVNNAARTIDLLGNIVTAGNFSTAGSYPLTLTQTASTTVTLPTTGTLATLAGSETLSSKVFTAPQINDTSADHQYVFAVSELTQDRTVTLPLLTANDTFVFENQEQTLTTKTMSGSNNTFSNIPGTAVTGAIFTVASGGDSTAISRGGTVTFTGTTNEVEIGESSGTITIGLPANVTISGNLTVSGTSTTVNTATLSVEDPLIALATGNDSSDAVDIGLYGLYDASGTDKYSGMFRDASDGKWRLFKDLTVAPTTTVTVGSNGYAVGTLVVDTEGTHTGPVSVTNLTLSGNLVVQGNTDLGNATSDTITFVGYIDSMLCPEADNTRDIGSNSYQWKDIYINGVGYIDAIATGCAITTPNIVTSLNDANSNAMIKFDAVGSAVNEITITNSTGTNPVEIKATGGGAALNLELSGKGTGGVVLTNATANGAYLDFDTPASPGDPGTHVGRMYLKTVDSNNNAIAVKIRKAGGIQEVEITSPKAVCGVCGSKDGASDPTYDFARGLMILDLWCGHSFEVPMQWSQINGDN